MKRGFPQRQLFGDLERFGARRIETAGIFAPGSKDVGEELSRDLVMLLVRRVGDFSVTNTADVAALGVGALLMALFSARHFGRFHGGHQPGRP